MACELIDYKTIMIIISIFIIIYLINNKNALECFTVSNENLSELYRSDYMNLLHITRLINKSKDDTLDFKVLSIEGNGILFANNVTINGDVTFNNYDEKTSMELLNQFARYTVLPWNSNKVPNGWALCDGKEYTDNGETIKTPNLIGRFILGDGMYTYDIKNKLSINYQPNMTGGYSNIILAPDNVSHKHTLNVVSTNVNNAKFFNNNNSTKDIIKAVNYTYEENDPYTYGHVRMINNSTKIFNIDTNNIKGTTGTQRIYDDTYFNPYIRDNYNPTEYQNANGAVIGLKSKSVDPLNNMPPYYAMIYIMKL